MEKRYFHLIDILAVITGDSALIQFRYGSVIRLARFITGENLGGDDVAAEDVTDICRVFLLDQLSQLREVQPRGPEDNLEQWLNAQIEEHGEKLAVKPPLKKVR